MDDVPLHLPLPFGLNCPEIPDSWVGGKLALLKHVADVLADGAHILLKQLGHLLLAEPDCFVDQPHFQLGDTVLGGVEQEFAGSHVRFPLAFLEA